jgi:two-component system, cell cycle response regulator
MALRVLLADESSTIKKVIQLSLQDFGVDVKSVTVGLDVLSVAKTYRPDVILADVLLAKRSGYEVCHDIKSDHETQNIPVVLMWSGFMEIDEQKARLCGADRRLEKPFDAAALRQIVQELVSRSQNNPASSFLQFPTLPAFEEPKKPMQQDTTPKNAIPNTPPVIPQNIPVMKAPQIPTQTPPEDDALVIDEIETENADEWIQQPINPKAPQQPGKNAQPTFPLPNENTLAPKPKEDDFTEFPLTQTAAPKAPQQEAQPQRQQQPQQPVRQPQQPQPYQQPAQQAVVPQVSEELVREEIQKWLAQHMPDIAERLIRDEINRLLQETEKTIQGP